MATTEPWQPALLPELYGAAIKSESLPGFLEQLMKPFGGRSASLRVTDLHKPRVHASWTAGFHASIDARYASELVARDMFREPLKRGPVGIIQRSHRIISDEAYERTDHYQYIFRPNGTFYAMGAHIARDRERAVHIGIHRARNLGPYDERERRALEFFSPHLRQAFGVMFLLEELRRTRRQSRAALDQLHHSIWLLDHELRCLWMNRAAEDNIRTGHFGLAVKDNRLRLAADDPRLRAAARAIRTGSSTVERIIVHGSGATLTLVSENKPAHTPTSDTGILAFLADPGQPVRADTHFLRTHYRLTPAEIRLLDQLLQGRDISEASAALGISPETARAQLKTVMRKTDTRRQAELIRVVLLHQGMLRADRPE